MGALPVHQLLHGVCPKPIPGAREKRILPSMRLFPAKPGFITDIPELPTWATARWVWHVAFWGMYAFSTIAAEIPVLHKPMYRIALGGSTFFLFIFTYYFTEILIPYVLYNKKIILFGFIGLLSCFPFSSITVLFFNTYCQPPEYQLGAFSEVSTYVLFMFMVTGLKFGKDWMLSQHQVAVAARKRAELDRDKVSQEMALLKGQLSPHFLFNTLNNLYGLAVVQASELPTLMLQLSDLLRYSLYETAAVRVPLHKEIEFIRNYVALEEIRCGSRYRIQLTLPAGIPSQRYLAPMMLVVLVENAFKHTRHLPDAHILIDIEGMIEDNTLIFRVENTADKGQTDTPRDSHSGIGLANLRQRLSGLYPGNHTFSAEFMPSLRIFRSELTLQLDRNA